MSHASLQTGLGSRGSQRHLVFRELSRAQEREDVPNRAQAAMLGGRGRGGTPAVTGEMEASGPRPCTEYGHHQ